MCQVTLDRAYRPSDLDLPGYRLHPLKGDLRGFWSITISSNWRIVFRLVKAGWSNDHWLRLQAAYDLAQARGMKDDIKVKRYQPQAMA
jgi:plasmid maintenance system killer protein